MPSTRYALPLAVAALLLTAGCSAATDLAGPEPAFEETELASFETVRTTCGDIRSDNTSSFSRPVPGGRTLSINATVPVRSNGTELDASLDEVGPNRYVLDIEREGGSGVPDCYLETRYNATLNLTDEVADDYTLLVTYDGVLVMGHYADPGASGGAGGLAPETRYAPWARNVSDANGGLGGSGGADSGTGSGSGSGGTGGSGGSDG